MNKKTKEKIMRVVAMYLVLNLLAEFIIPIPAHALTGGPSQPEVESFEPVSTSEMVNLFTGDFNYNIPLLTVPGPNGGYPINLAYHAGIGMEQEASWTGLGWNINPGVINRNMRGLPDDFEGDKIRKTLSYKPQITWGLDYSQFSISATGIYNFWNYLANGGSEPDLHEYFGFDDSKVGPTFSTQVHYNNYKGIGYGINLSLADSWGDAQSSHFSGALALSYDTDGGLGVTPSISYTTVSSNLQTLYRGTLSTGYHSRNGELSLNITTAKEVFKNKKYRDHGRFYETEKNVIDGKYYETGDYFHMTSYVGFFQSQSGPGVAFSSGSTIPGVTTATRGNNINFGVTIGKPDKLSLEFSKYSKRKFNMSCSAVESAELDSPYDGFGFLYLQSFTDDGKSLADFNRETNAPANKNATAISSGYVTQDVMFVSGQGISGAFKPFRSEYGSVYDVQQTMQVPGARVNVEFGQNLEATNPEYELGGDYGVNYSQSYSGDWKTGISDVGDLVFTDAADGLNEPAYYKSMGEMTASAIDEMLHIGGEEAVRFNLHSVVDGDLGIVTKLENELVTNQNSVVSNDLNANNARTSRQKRVQLLSYRTSGQIELTIGYGTPFVSIYDANEFPSFDTPANFDYGSKPGHHIGEVTVTNPDGTRYVYGLPVYNTSQKEVMFAKDDIAENNFDKTQEYSDGADNRSGNSEGFDNLYMSTEIPDYAYSYLVTAIYSADYVDLTGNGPSEDDFGYWVKFNYSQSVDGEYGWRVPYRDANYSKGHISDLMDDKLSYMYGTKEVYYLNSVETKTHEAHFILNDNGVSGELRADANGVTDEDFQTGDNATTEKLHYLKSIKLISKKDPTTVLKEVHFRYNYTLCANVENNNGTVVTQDLVNINAAEGKLTLEKVWFSNLGNEKGRLSPYIFTYDVGGDYDNPAYGQDQMDRWGNYMPDRTVSDVEYLNTENPYVNQSGENNDYSEYAAAWNLKKITLPSGGEIEIEYEGDDYAFVQDQKAMQVQRIVGMGTIDDIDVSTSEAVFANSSDNSRVGDRYTLVFFELERALDIDTDPVLKDSIFQYVEGVEDIYFKVFMKLKHKPPGYTGDPYAVDYVEGYCKPDKIGKWYGYCQPEDGVIKWGWIKVLKEERNPWNLIGQLDQPFKLAGWQYMRMERADLFSDGNLFDEDNNVVESIQAFINLFNDVEKLFGYFNFCSVNNYCERLFLKDEIEMEEDPKPSWIRLNSPDGIKYGGGHRVKSVTITDKWEDMTSDSDPDNAKYGTTYSYRMPDGTSSGVAEYEPLIGGEENALRKPLRYAERKFPYKNDGLYAEEPFGEGLYPAPNVGYRRVVVRSINNDIQPEDGTPNVTVNRAGITVTEFYTAKEFPVINDYTDLQKKNFGIPVIIPFIGEISYNNKGYSQGFCLELNNMHGQVKSRAVYPADTNVDNSGTQATSKAEYIYQTQDKYNPNGVNKLSNRVDVLTTDGVYDVADIGKTHEFYIDRQQHSNFSVSAGIQTNAGAVPPYVFWGNVFPYFEISRSVYRSISTMKIIQRNGVLSEVREYKDGAKSTNKTLMYDAETGQPLLTQTINNHNRPVYTYNYASHWAYDRMGPAYKNQGAFFNDADITSGVLSYIDPEKYFVLGDEVQMDDGSSIEIIWVSDVDVTNDEVTFIDEAGNPVATVTDVDLTILRSGRRNQQISTDGVIVSLSNPVTQRKFPLFDAMKAYDASALTTQTSLDFDDFYTDCFTGAVMDADFDWVEGTNTLHIATLGSLGEETYGCEATLVVPDALLIDNMKDVFDHDFIYVAATGGVVVQENGIIYNCTLTAPQDCFHACLDDVLHAEAYRFKDEWSFNYIDFGNPSNDAKSTGLQPMADGVYPNDYRFGTLGIWRTEESWLYQVDRKQTTTSPSLTSVARDGTYKHFVLHNWSASADHATQNPLWTLTNTVTMYDPHGYEVENVNPLGIYSSAMYGYESSLPVAVASNTMFRELAYEGFEECPSIATYEADRIHYGHTIFTSVNPGAPIDVTADYAHTGRYSLAVASNGSAVMDFVIGATNTNQFNPLPDKQYHLSVWVKCASGSTPGVIVENVDESTTLATGTVDMSQNAIDGWRQVNLDFTTDDDLDNLTITLDCSSPTSGICYFDDLRIQPFTSGMKTYVYNPLTLWLVAELDDRNYATFYNYDEEGHLVQVKKETENGIVTISSSRSNIKR